MSTMSQYYEYEKRTDNNNIIKTTMTSFFAKHYDVPWLTLNWIIAVTWITNISIAIGILSSIVLIVHKIMQCYQQYLETKDFKDNKKQVEDYVKKLEKGTQPTLKKAVRVKSKTINKGEE